MKAPVRLAICAALPREVRGLVGRTAPEGALLPRGIHLYRLQGAVVVAAGMGATRVALAFEAALAQGPLDLVISAGLAGACRSEFRPGIVAEATVVIDARTGERLATTASGDAVLVTTQAIAGVQEKARLATTYGAAMVDMEAATVARLAAAHCLAFRAVKGISDAHDFELASLARFAGAHGQFRTAAFALHTAVRPHAWRHAARLGRHSTQALDALHTRLRVLLTQPS